MLAREGGQHPGLARTRRAGQQHDPAVGLVKGANDVIERPTPLDDPARVAGELGDQGAEQDADHGGHAVPPPGGPAGYAGSAFGSRSTIPLDVTCLPFFIRSRCSTSTGRSVAGRSAPIAVTWSPSSISTSDLT